MRSNLYLLGYLLTSWVLLVPVYVFASANGGDTNRPFVPLVGIPGLTNNASDINVYINTLYALAISLAALIAVVKIVIAGAKYMLDDTGITSKASAKADIQNSLIGLLIIIGAVLILSTINRNLTNFTISANPIELQGVSFQRGVVIQADDVKAVKELLDGCNDTDRTGGCKFNTCQAIGEYVAEQGILQCALNSRSSSWWNLLPIISIVDVSGAAFDCSLAQDKNAFTSFFTSDTNTDLCRNQCDWAGGTYLVKNGADSCVIPNNADKLRAAQLKDDLEAANKLRAKDAETVATVAPKSATEAFGYFDLEETILSDEKFGDAVTFFDDIPVTHQATLKMLHDINADDIMLGKIKGQIILEKNVSDDPAKIEEHKIMLANVETKARQSCEGGTVAKVFSFDHTAEINDSKTQTTYLYCIKN